MELSFNLFLNNEQSSSLLWQQGFLDDGCCFGDDDGELVRIDRNPRVNATQFQFIPKYHLNNS